MKLAGVAGKSIEEDMVSSKNYGTTHGPLEM